MTLKPIDKDTLNKFKNQLSQVKNSTMLESSMRLNKYQPIPALDLSTEIDFENLT
jgi:hypothetical protein